MEQKIIKKIKNEENSKIFVGDVLLFELNDPGDCGLNPTDMAAFRSARHKNDMPSVFKFGEKTEAMKDCLSEIGESGESIKEKTGGELKPGAFYGQ